MSKSDFVPYLCGPVLLRLLTEADLPMTLRWRNQDEIRRWFFYNKVLTLEQHQGWFEKYQGAEDDYVFIIEDAEAGCPVGQVSLYHIDWQAGQAEFGRLMVGEPSARGKGIGLAATRAALEVAAQLGLKKVYLEVLTDNTRAYAIYESAGFVLARTDDQSHYMEVELSSN